MVRKYISLWNSPPFSLASVFSMLPSLVSGAHCLQQLFFNRKKEGLGGEIPKVLEANSKVSVLI